MKKPKDDPLNRLLIELLAKQNDRLCSDKKAQTRTTSLVEQSIRLDTPHPHKSVKTCAPFPHGSRPSMRRVGRLIQLCHALISQRGEASGYELARKVSTGYLALDEQEQADFFNRLANEFSPRPEAVSAAWEAYRENPSSANLVRLQVIIEPPRQELFRRMNIARQGTRTIVELRRHLFRHLRANPQLAGIEADLIHLLRSWFNRGFLEMRRIDWRTSALVLEKLIEYEAVHEIQGWLDLRRRLQADRRCYAYFHPVLPDEPIIFIEVALTAGLEPCVGPLLDPVCPVFDVRGATHAIFYSITNCQEGLRGISFGSFLIKQVAQDLAREFPRLETFATLSPVPDFRAWLKSGATPEGNALDAALDAPTARDDAALRDAILALGARYLLTSKQGREPLDSVARFHLRNGARLERLNWPADASKRGWERSGGLMVNYVYDLSNVELNHEAYVTRGKITCAEDIAALAAGSGSVY